MAEETWVRVVIRTSSRIRATLKKVVADAGQTKVFARRKGTLTQEVFVAATWLWISTMDPEELAARVLPFVDAAQSSFLPENLDRDITERLKQGAEDLRSVADKLEAEGHPVIEKMRELGLSKDEALRLLAGGEQDKERKKGLR